MYSNSQFMTIRGLKIHYRIVEPVGAVRHRALLVASPFLSTFCWRYIVPELTGAGCMCVLVDLPGYGLSECRDDAPQDPETCARFLWGVLDALDLTEGDALNCWHLMAHGLACNAIAAMALMQPDSVSSLFLVSPAFYPPLTWPLRLLARRPSFERFIRRCIQRHILRRPAFNRLVSRIYACPLPDRIVAQIQRPLLRLAGHEGMLRRQLLEGHQLHTELLNHLFMPAMIIWGGRDPILGHQIPKRLSTDFKQAECHLLPSAGHCPMETNSRAVRDFLRGWIRELWQG